MRKLACILRPENEGKLSPGQEIVPFTFAEFTRFYPGVIRGYHAYIVELTGDIIMYHGKHKEKGYTNKYKVIKPYYEA